MRGHKVVEVISHKFFYLLLIKRGKINKLKLYFYQEINSVFVRSMLDAGKKNMENNNLYDALNMYNKAVVFAPNIDDNLGNTQIIFKQQNSNY